jgi:hypothetical protein
MQQQGIIVQVELPLAIDDPIENIGRIGMGFSIGVPRPERPIAATIKLIAGLEAESDTFYFEAAGVQAQLRLPRDFICFLWQSSQLRDYLDKSARQTDGGET